jgi:hypothetical protein
MLLLALLSNVLFSLFVLLTMSTNARSTGDSELDGPKVVAIGIVATLTDNTLAKIGNQESIVAPVAAPDVFTPVSPRPYANQPEPIQQQITFGQATSREVLRLT